MVSYDGINEPEFNGQLILTNKTLSLRGTSVLLSNIVGLDQHGIPRKYLVTRWQLLLSAVVIAVFLPQVYWGLLFVVPALIVIAVGIRERRKPDLYGISLELTSGREYKIISRDIQGICLLCSRIKEAMRNGATTKCIVNFSRGRIQFDQQATSNAISLPQTNPNNAFE